MAGYAAINQLNQRNITCAGIRRRPERIVLARSDRRSKDLLRFAEGDQDVGGLDVQVGELLLVQVLQTAGHLVGNQSRTRNNHKR